MSIIYLSSQGNIADFFQRVKNWVSCARQRRVWRRLEAGVCSHCPILPLRGHMGGKDDVREWKSREKETLARESLCVGRGGVAWRKVAWVSSFKAYELEEVSTLGRGVQGKAQGRAGLCV